MNVKLLSITPNADGIIYTAARQCYYPGWVGSEEFQNGVYTEEEQFKLINHVLSSGHMSVSEHPSATVAISGISRACSHQLVRSRIGVSFSQQSQRYCGLGENDFVIPKSILKNPAALSRFNSLMVATKACYDFMINEDIPAEDARMALPNATTTNLVMTMDFRAWLHFFEERLCTCAQWEIRKMANKIKDLLSEESEIFRKYAGPKCHALGYCNESKSRSCGKKPLKSEVFSAWKAANDKNI